MKRSYKRYVLITLILVTMFSVLLLIDEYLTSKHSDIFYAISRADPELLEAKLAEGEGINGRSQFHENALTAAINWKIHSSRGIQLSQEEEDDWHDKTYLMVELLIKYGADVNAVDNGSKQPPLFRAVRSQMPDVTELLLKNGANPNIVDSTGHGLLFYTSNPEVREILIKYGAEI